MLRIPTEKLMLVAGVVWFLAGANILNLGVQAYLHDWGWVLPLLVVGSCAIFAVFHIRIFTGMVAKHTARIYGYDEPRKNVFAFFDAKGYVMMAIMMGGGIGLRMSGLVPDWFIAFFYTGIGLALAMAGVDFLVRYFRSTHEWSCPFLPSTWRKGA
ncbi:MAG: hypothetical protein Q4C41_01895 [Eggerthellaceae bacterium]|nr:hypothetical protein [Eggerthellaceae bacterium]